MIEINENIVSGVYKITSPSGRVYVGQSSDINKRILAYKYLLCKNQIILYASLKKYGFENHVFEVIEQCSIERLNEREEYYVRLYNSNDPATGMNCTSGGGGMKRYKWRDESRDKIRDTYRKLYASGFVNSFSGKSHSDETKQIISAKSKGRKHSEESLLKSLEWRKDGVAVARWAKNHKAGLLKMWQEIKANGERYDNLLKKRQTPHAMSRPNESGYRGVYYERPKGLYRVVLQVSGRVIRGGRFKSPRDAAVKYNELAIIHLGESAILNKVD